MTSPELRQAKVTFRLTDVLKLPLTPIFWDLNAKLHENSNLWHIFPIGDADAGKSPARMLMQDGGLVDFLTIRQRFLEGYNKRVGKIFEAENFAYATIHSDLGLFSIGSNGATTHHLRPGEYRISFCTLSMTVISPREGVVVSANESNIVMLNLPPRGSCIITIRKARRSGFLWWRPDDADSFVAEVLSE